ncbi:hypothetical protein VB738_16250, partial [Cyanobium gracile UHCC 0139]
PSFSSLLFPSLPFHPMAPSLGSLPNVPAPITVRGPQPQAKKKGCRQKKCSKWKGGKCCCGRD